MYNAGQKFLLRQYLLLIVSRHMSFFNQIFCRGDRKYSWLENFLLSVLRPIQFWLFGYKAPIFICRRHSSTNILPRSDSIWWSNLMHSHNFCLLLFRLALGSLCATCQWAGRTHSNWKVRDLFYPYSSSSKFKSSFSSLKFEIFEFEANSNFFPEFYIYSYFMLKLL